MSIGDIPIERYICNFINEVPLPPPGKAEVQYGIADKILTFTRPPLNKPILDVDLPFRRVFECLTPSTIITLFTCLLLEQKILMHSHRLSLLTDVAELLQAFMYPMSWGHVYVPVLPRCLFDVIKAPMPFLLGKNRIKKESFGLDRFIVLTLLLLLSLSFRCFFLCFFFFFFSNRNQQRMDGRSVYQ